MERKKITECDYCYKNTVHPCDRYGEQCYHCHSCGNEMWNLTEEEIQRNKELSDATYAQLAKADRLKQYLKLKEEFEPKPGYNQEIPDYLSSDSVCTIEHSFKMGRHWDAFGYPVKDGKMNKTIRIRPPYFYNLPEDATHIAWFHK